MINNLNMNTTIDKAQQWFLQSAFSSPELLLEAPPQGMETDDMHSWNTIITLAGGNVEFLFKRGSYASQQSTKAAGRYKKLWKIRNKFPYHLPFCLTLAECHFLMNDTRGASSLAGHAQDILHRRGQHDDVLDNTVKMLTILAEHAMDEPANYHNAPPDVHVLEYSRPPEWDPSSIPSNLAALQIRWVELQKKSDGAEEFARYAAVTTNELEGLFLLDGDSSRRLARCGLYANSIEGIKPQSRQKQPQKIISIIKNTQQCYNVMKDVISGKSEFDKSFLETMHSQLMQDNNIKTDFDDDDELAATIVPMGVYRGVPCFARHDSAGYITDFCPPREIEMEIEWLLGEVQAILSDQDLDPYRAAAWIQHAFLRIHPFADGNGRVGRLISSIPLLREQLPPVYVAKESKREYFAVLKEADDEGDIDALAAFLQAETFRAMENLLKFDESQPYRRICLKKKKKKRRSGRMAVIARRRASL